MPTPPPCRTLPTWNLVTFMASESEKGTAIMILSSIPRPYGRLGDIVNFSGENVIKFRIFWQFFGQILCNLGIFNFYTIIFVFGQKCPLPKLSSYACVPLFIDAYGIRKETRNTLDRDQSNYSSRFVFSHILNFIKQEIAPFDPPTPKTPS